MEVLDNYWAIKEEHVINSNQENREAQCHLDFECEFFTREDILG